MKKSCARCGAEFEPEGERERNCLRCTALMANKWAIDSMRRRLDRLRPNARRQPRTVHRGRITCVECGASEAREWVTRSPSLCLTCRGRSVRRNDRRRRSPK